MLRRRLAIVAGPGKAADAAAQGLVAAEFRVRRLPDAEAVLSFARAAEVCVLAGAPESLPDLLQHLASSRRLRWPLRVILLDALHGTESWPTLPDGPPLRITRFDPAREAARRLLARWPLHAGLDPGFGQRLHLLIAGTAPPAQAIALQTLRLAHYGGSGPVLTLASADPEARRAALLADYPQVGQWCRLRFEPIEAVGLGGEPPVTAAFVCVDPPEDGLRLARSLSERTAEAGAGGAPIYLETGGACARGGIDDWDGRILPFAYLQEACRAEVLLDGRGDELARVIHDHYRDSIAAQGRDPATEAAGRPWEELDGSYRDASRQQADHLWAKLALVDCRAVPEEQVEVFAFTPLEVERLAVIEHQRWAADRWLAGWTYAPVRDNSRRHHPQLVPYEDLSEPMKDLDRYAVRLVPTLLARAGRGVLRLLLVGVPASGCPADRSLRRLTERTLERLALRYPDRSLVLASTLEDAASRLIARLALDRYDAGLFLLCPRPLASTLAAQSDAAARRDLLELVARAERRIPLAGEAELARWLSERAEIAILTGDGVAAEAPQRQVRLDPAEREPQWGFEY